MHQSMHEHLPLGLSFVYDLLSDEALLLVDGTAYGLCKLMCVQGRGTTPNASGGFSKFSCAWQYQSLLALTAVYGGQVNGD